MPELWDIYDENKNKTGRTAIRDVTILQKGEYHIVVTGIILNSKNEILISKRATNKKFGGMWECNGGSILAGETSKEGILRELKEELGVIFKPEEAIFLKEVKRERVPQNFKDLW
ncbi:MAG: NUDIX domain-containing protein, partial [Clostridiales bacterium]